jgi:Site-specific recombinases, DNA invertase Pin homologs
VRCAIYTRKSTDEGLDLDFNSLDAQRESAEAYIASQRHEKWLCISERYDDGGFTGGNMERPALKRLIADIEAGGIDCVVVYKVDRLSRSLLDFSRLMELFDKHAVSFVSVTQQFNTTSSMGRLTLNILFSFAQFEREIISERTRDKMSAARKKGKWVGGTPALGYDVDPKGGRLIVNDDEAARVRAIYDLYMDRKALMPVVSELERRKMGKETVDDQARGYPRRESVHEEQPLSIAHQRCLHGQRRLQGNDLQGRARGNCGSRSLAASPGYAETQRPFRGKGCTQ